MSAFEAQQHYIPASNGGGRTHGGAASFETSYKPTAAECAQLVAPIAEFLQHCSCYDMLGVSTQVVVLDVEAPLSVAFIAAQETRIQSCVLWDSKKRAYVGVLTSTDYVRILLYCQSHPQEAEAVASWTIQHWRRVKERMDNKETLEFSSPSDAGTSTPPSDSGGLVSCKSDTSLHDCLKKMKEHKVRRIVSLAEKEGEDFSIVAMLDVEQVVEYLGVMFFHIERAGGSVCGSASQRMLGAAEEEGRSGGGGSSGGAGLSGTSNTRSRNTVIGAGGDCDDEDEMSSLFALGDAYVLPPYVASIISLAENGGNGGGLVGSDTRVGPYSSIFDVPFVHTPAVGVHRCHPIFITMENQLSDALQRMLDEGIESIAVCSPADQVIVDVISRSDLLRMENQGVYDTRLTVREALASKISDRVFVFYEKDTIRDIFSHFVRRRVKELFIVDPDTGRLLGQLNVAEFVFFLVFAWVKPKL